MDNCKFGTRDFKRLLSGRLVYLSSNAWTALSDLLFTLGLLYIPFTMYWLPVSGSHVSHSTMICVQPRVMRHAQTRDFKRTREVDWST